MEKIFGKSWKTSLVGIIMLAGAVASVMLGKTNWIDAGAVITAGAGFILAKDSGK